jgi:hypothetical protein
MRRLNLMGITYDLTEEEYWRILTDTAVASQIAAQYVHGAQRNGFVDVMGKRDIKELKQSLRVLEEVIEQIENSKLKDLFRLLAIEMGKFNQTNERLVEYLAHYFDMPMPLSEKNRRKLHTIVNNSDPVWVNKNEYRPFSQESEQIFEKIKTLVEQIVSFISILSASSSG